MVGISSASTALSWLLLLSPVAHGAALQGAAQADSHEETKRGAFSAVRPWHKAEIPFVLERLPSQLGDAIRDGMRAWQTSTCIRFVPYKTQSTWINFRKYDDGCFAESVGQPAKEGEVLVNFDAPSLVETVMTLGTYKACMTPGYPAHTLGRLIGLANEHQRPDRDEYIRILMNRVDPTYRHQFDLDLSANTSLPFDYNSVMMYGSKTFAKRPWSSLVVGEKAIKHTMESRTLAQINPWDTPTPGDYDAVNKAYGCPEETTRLLPECTTATIPTDSEHSSYKFIVDRMTLKYARNNGYTHFGVHQHCNSWGIKTDTDNWGFIAVGGAGADSQYYLGGINRCKKDHSRHAAEWEIALCRGDYEGACDVYCGRRNICPQDGSGLPVDSKAVDVVDDVLWVCHPL